MVFDLKDRLKHGNGMYWVTPEWAQNMLENHNPNNRHLSVYRAQGYANDMRNGEWQGWNWEPIKIRKNGELFDGQHRLMAVVIYGKPVQMAIVWDIPNETSVCDMGKVRSYTNVLQIEGMESELATNANVAVAKLHYEIQCSKTVCTPSLCRDFLYKYGTTILFLRGIKVGKGRKKTACAPFILGCLYALESGVPRGKIERIVRIIETGDYDVHIAGEVSAKTFMMDIIDHKVDFGTRNGTTTRRHGCFQTEKMIWDFVNKKDRKKTYSICTEPVYSSNPQFKINTNLGGQENGTTNRAV